MEDRVERLLQAVWGGRSGFVFLPYKVQPEEWHETPGIPYAGSSKGLKEPSGRVDRYFCPVVFSEAKRKKEFALPTNVLWADLDPVNPNDCRIKPSIAWESSPGRYQALWFLSQDVPPDEAAALSKRIAYADGGDKGGWDLTQVLRIPGTKNYKYDSAPDGRILWAKSNSYSPEEIRGAYPAVNGSEQAASSVWAEVDDLVVQTAITSLPVGLRRRLMQDTAGADRSTELQKLTRDLIRFGVSPQIVLHLIQRSTWNKFNGRNDEHTQLLKQVDSAIIAVAERKQKAKKPREDVQLEVQAIEEMEVHKWGDFMQIPTTLKWLVDDAWVDGAVGFISGRSKSYKTWIAFDLALSIVSGAPFLGRYPVRRTGPVLLIQEEDPRAVVQERLRLIAKSKGMLPHVTGITGTTISIEYPDFPLHIINLQGFSLGSTERVAQVRKLIAEINPVMVILDPLIVMLGDIEENKATAVSAVLQGIKMWREEFGCSVVVVHHWNKGKVEEGERFAEHMYGSFAFHAWLECALHVRPIIEEDQDRINEVIVEREFKAASSGGSLRLKFNIDTVKEYTYQVEFQDTKKIGQKEQSVLDALTSTGPMSTPELTAMLGIRRPDLVEICGRMVRSHLIMGRKGGGRGNPTLYWMPDQEPPPEK